MKLRASRAVALAALATAACTPMAPGGDVASDLDATSSDGYRPDVSPIADERGATDARDASSAEAAPDATLPADASDDASVDGSTDASSDASDAALPPLTCAHWTHASPILLDDLDATGGDASATLRFDQPLVMGTSTDTALNVVAAFGSATTVYRLYSLDRASHGVTPSEGPSGEAQGFISIHDAFDGLRNTPTTAIGANLVDGRGVAFLYSTPCYGVVDASAGRDCTPRLWTSAAFPPVVDGGSWDRGAYLPMDNLEIFGVLTAMTHETPQLVEVYASRGSRAGVSAPVSFASSVNGRDFPYFNAVHANHNVYAFGSHLAGGVSSWVVPETAIPAGNTPTHDFAKNEAANVMALGRGASPNTTNIAYEAWDPSRTQVTFKVGQVDDTHLGEVTVDELTTVGTFPAREGFDSPEPVEWRGDQLVVTALAPNGDGGVSGFNLLWTDARGEVRAHEVWPNNLLTDRPLLWSVNAVVTSSSATAARIDVVWAEGDRAQRLYYNQLECQ